MNSDLEFFLESAFDNIQSTSSGIGRVVVEPNYDAEMDESEKAKLTAELVACLQENGEAQDFVPSPKFPILTKYIHRITLHSDTLDGPWVEVAPPGNWI